MKLFEYADQLCREAANKVTTLLSINKRVDDILDEVCHIGKPVERDAMDPDVCYSSYIPDGYVSHVFLFFWFSIPFIISLFDITDISSSSLDAHIFGAHHNDDHVFVDSGLVNCVFTSYVNLFSLPPSFQNY